MKSLESSTSDSSDHDKPSMSTAERSPVQLRAYQPSSGETNGEAHVSTVQVVAGSAGSQDVESASDTGTEDSEESTDSESTVSADDNHAAEGGDFTTHSSPPVTVLHTATYTTIRNVFDAIFEVNLS